MVHLLVLGLLALLFGGIAGGVGARNLFLFYGFSRSGHSQSIVSIDVVNGVGIVFTDDSPALSQHSHEVETSCGKAKKTKRPTTDTAAREAEAG